jgi:hypothetical protein
MFSGTPLPRYYFEVISLLFKMQLKYRVGSGKVLIVTSQFLYKWYRVLLVTSRGGTVIDGWGGAVRR